jgi:hypothetical protein
LIFFLFNRGNKTINLYKLKSLFIWIKKLLSSYIGDGQSIYITGRDNNIQMGFFHHLIRRNRKSINSGVKKMRNKKVEWERQRERKKYNIPILLYFISSNKPWKKKQNKIVDWTKELKEGEEGRERMKWA